MKTIQSTVQTAAMAAAMCLGLSQGLAAACVLSTGESADLALGQPGLVSGTANTGGLSAASLDVPERLSSDGVHLVVPDAVNNRVLLWNSLPTGTGQGADVVLGQPGFTTNLANQGGPAAANTLYEPGAAFVAGGHLFVSDYGNNRVLIWNSIPTANDTPADLVLGQTAFSGAAVNAGGLSASSLYQPGGVKFEAGRLLVADAFNHRILIWNSLPTASGQAADLVLGQSGFTTNN
ncbi:MAG TPA: hypothetical protein VNZ67_03625, partial [bacterium]|nr:hypothetical protein [bacterium]